MVWKREKNNEIVEKKEKIFCPECKGKMIKLKAKTTCLNCGYTIYD